MTDAAKPEVPTVAPNPEAQSATGADRRFEDLPPAAQRALKEAEDRRLKAEAAARPKEINGRKGPEPVRYGDWEVKGIASDF